jgi:ribonuclease III
VHAARLDLGRHLLMGRGEEASGGRQRDSNLGDAFEALLGAIYLDSDLETVRRFILELMRADLERLEEEPLEVNPKGQLQEILQAISPRSPDYELLTQSGREHEKTFSVRVVWEGQVLGEGSGRSKKLAESAAALMALREQGWKKQERSGPPL